MTSALPSTAPVEPVAPAPIPPFVARTRALALASLIALFLLCLAWELWLAPLRPGGSYLALKAVPLALPLYGILFGKRYTYQWTSMFILVYFTEGVMRAWGDRGLSQGLAGAEVMLTLVFFASVVGYARLTRQHA